MYDTQYGHPGMGPGAADAAPSDCGCGGAASPGPTPSPYPPSPMMPGPSMQPGGCGGSSDHSSVGEGPAQPGPSEGHSGHSACQGGHQKPGDPMGEYAGPGSSPTASMHHPPLHEAYHYGYYPHGVPASQYAAPGTTPYSVLGLNLSDGNFWKGALLGAAVTLLVTNEKVQKAVMTGVVKAYSAAQDGVGELKEKFEDVQAELKKPKG